MAPDERHAPAIASAVTEISERASLLVREEIELAKAEVTASAQKLIRAVVVGAAAGVFVLTGLLFLLHAAAWGIWATVFDAGNTDIGWGFLVLALILFILAGVAGFLAFKFVKKGTPPTPVMAIDEAKKIRATVTAKSASVADHAAAGSPTPTPPTDAPAGAAESLFEQRAAPTAPTEAPAAPAAPTGAPAAPTQAPAAPTQAPAAPTQAPAAPTQAPAAPTGAGESLFDKRAAAGREGTG